MTARRYLWQAMLGTFSVLFALLSVRLALADSRPILGFNTMLTAAPTLLPPHPADDRPLVRLGFDQPEYRVPLFEYCPLVEVMQPGVAVIPASLEMPAEAALTGHVPLLEYRPCMEVLQPVAYTQPAERLPTEVTPLPEAPRPVQGPIQASPCPAPVSNSIGCCPFMPILGPDGCWDPCLATCKRFCGSLCECLCCPDPCYRPCWQPIMDSAFDAAAVRPRTHQRIRWDAGLNLVLPDRSEFFWARADGNGRGPAPPSGRLLASNRIRYDDVSYTFEAAIERFALIVSAPYRSLSPTDYPDNAGFGDMKFGGKAVVFDCELLQIGTQLLAYAPTGNASKGLGTAHWSLEPSLLFGIRVGPETYLQAQVSEWIPLRGDGDYAGAILHTHVAFNRTLCQPRPDCTLIGTFGFNTWTFQDGAYTDPIFGSNQRSSGTTYSSLAGGVRLFICDCIDLGFNAQFSLTDPHFADQLYTTEFRLRF